MPSLNDLNSLTAAIQSLVSGFVACWIFYAMTAHQKPTATEQGIQALIFTAFIQVAVAIAKGLAYLIGKIPHCNFGPWPKECDLATGLLFGIVFGFSLAVAANRDFPFCHFRKWKLTKKHTFPSVWYHKFNDTSWSPWAVLHINPGKDSPRESCRLTGWITEWPDDSKMGHFVVMQAAWLMDNGQIIELNNVESVMISAAEVEMVEFLKRTQDNIDSEDKTHGGLSEEGDRNTTGDSIRSERRSGSEPALADKLATSAATVSAQEIEDVDDDRKTTTEECPPERVLQRPATAEGRPGDDPASQREASGPTSSTTNQEVDNEGILL